MKNMSYCVAQNILNLFTSLKIFGCLLVISSNNKARIVIIKSMHLQISNNQGELYSLSVRTPHFKWIQDLSSIGKNFTATPGNNGRLYITVPARALLLALHVSTGTILWQKPIGPLSREDYVPTVDMNGKLTSNALQKQQKLNVNGILQNSYCAWDIR